MPDNATKPPVGGPKFKEGQRVILPAVPERNLMEERGEVLSYHNPSGTYIVRTDHPLSPYDDRLREVLGSDMEPDAG
jgi:hypothetical protein